MKALALTIAATSALLALGPAGAQTLPGGVLAGPLSPQPGSGSLYPTNGSLFPGQMPAQGVGRVSRGGGHRGNRGGSTNFIYYEEPYAVHDVVVVHDEPAESPPPPPPPPAPREPYVLGKSYASLPGSCMKMIESGESYYYCSGEWYRQVGEGSAALYKAVAKP